MPTLYLTKRAWEQIEKTVRLTPTVETGGVLMGFQTEERDWVVAYASHPGPNAIQEPNAILFDDPYLWQVIRKIRSRSSNRLQYIGDWHSHTIRRLTPSKADRITVFQKTYEQKYDSTSPLMLIVGIGKSNKLQGRGFILSDALREVEEIAFLRHKVRPLRTRKPG